MEFIKILGIVKSFKQNVGDDQGGIIVVEDRNSQKEIKIVCPFFCPARKFDVIQGYCVQQSNGMLRFAQSPVVEPPSSREAIQSVFIICMGKLRMSRPVSDKVYLFFENEARLKSRVLTNVQDKGSSDFTIYKNKDLMSSATVETISWYSNNFRYDPSVIEPLVNLGLSTEQAEKLLRGWYKNFTLRRLYLLGLTKKEIKDSVARGWAGTKGIINSADALYYQLLENPYIPEKVPVNKCQGITTRYGLSFSQNILESADVVRYVDQQTTENGWMCFPVYGLMRRYRDLMNCLTH